MQNIVPVPTGAGPGVERELADRTLAGRRDAYAAEVRRLIDAAFAAMRTSGDIDPQVRDIVREAGLSNQAFYRHFASKDELLLAVLADGQRQLVDTLCRRVASTTDPRVQIARWIQGVLAQAHDADAADATRPFALNGARLAARFPSELSAIRSRLVDTLEPSVRAVGGTRDDASFVCSLALARMSDAIAARHRPDRSETRALVDFCLAGVCRGA